MFYHSFTTRDVFTFKNIKLYLNVKITNKPTNCAGTKKTREILKLLYCKYPLKLNNKERINISSVV